MLLQAAGKAVVPVRYWLSNLDARTLYAVLRGLQLLLAVMTGACHTRIRSRDGAGLGFVR